MDAGWCWCCEHLCLRSLLFYLNQWRKTFHFIISQTKSLWMNDHSTHHYGAMSVFLMKQGHQDQRWRDKENKDTCHSRNSHLALRSNNRDPVLPFCVLCPRRRALRHTQRPLIWKHNMASQENTRHHTVRLPYTLLRVCLCIKLQWQGRDKEARCSARASSQTTIHTRTLFTRLKSKRISWRLRGAQCHYHEGSGQVSGPTRCTRDNCSIFRPPIQTLCNIFFFYSADNSCSLTASHHGLTFTVWHQMEC